MVEIVMELLDSELAKYTVSLVILSFLFRTIIKFWLDKETRLFQQTLVTKLDDYEHKLEKERIRLQISYGGIFEKQAEALLSLHRSLVDLQNDASDAMNEAPEDTKLKMEFRKSWVNIRIEYSKNRALLPEDIDENAKDFLENILNGFLSFQSVERRLLRRPSDDEFDKLLLKQDEATKLILVEVPKIEQKLVETMRIRLGVSHVN